MSEAMKVCPHCGQAVTGLQWEATLVRSNRSQAGVIGGAIYDTWVSGPPGTYTAEPCGHGVPREAAETKP